MLGGKYVKNYVNLALKKEKKAVSFEKVCERIEKIALKDNPDFTLTNDMKKEIKSILDNGVKKCEYYLSPSNNYTLMSKTSFRKGRFVADRNGNGVVSVTTSSLISFVGCSAFCSMSTVSTFFTSSSTVSFFVAFFAILKYILKCYYL